jgi:hypothetical protein
MGENRTHHTVRTVSRVSEHGDRAGLNHSSARTGTGRFVGADNADGGDAKADYHAGARFPATGWRLVDPHRGNLSSFSQKHHFFTNI